MKENTQPIEISQHLIRVLDFVTASDRWVTTNEIAAGAVVAKRTAANHASMLTDLGVFQRVQVFGGFRYRLADAGVKRAKEFYANVNMAREAFATVAA